MITETPTPEEFAEQGINHLHLAWEIGVALLRDRREADEYGKIGPEASQHYWRLSQPSLGNAFALIQQAQEFLLKSKIARVTPFLLLSRNASEWPRGSERRDRPFSAFRMVDAVDLLKIHDTTTDNRLPKEFGQFYEDIRRQRNAIMHVGLRGQNINVTNIVLAVLQTHAFLLSEESWTSHRWKFINSDRISALYSNDHAGDAILTEFDGVIDVLKPAPLRKFFRFDKKARRYICPTCMNRTENLDYRPAFAQLDPNTPDSKMVYCFVCENHTPVLRKECTTADCRSNVILEEDGETCLVCW